MKYYLAPVAACLVLTACGGSSSSSDGGSDRETSTTAKTVAIDFKAVADGQDIACGTTYVVGTADTDVNVTDFRFYVHNVRLVTDSGTEVTVTLDQNDWQNGDIAMLDFRDKDTDCSGDAKDVNTAITGTVPDDSLTYTGVRFTIGVPEDRNHLLNADQPSPMNAPNMFWAWTSGYKFMKLDVTPVGGTVWSFHLGSGGCTGNPATGETAECLRINRPEIALDGFDVDTDTIQFDYGNLVANSNVSQNLGGAPGCMSGNTDPECPEVFTALGLNLDSGENDPNLVQTVFSIAP